MNEEYSHLTATGDEATEARIIAWVLGETSAFESAELEKLCSDQPEWRVFQRRMHVLHDCLREAHTAQPSSEWKLPDEKRQKLNEVMGGAEKAKPSIKHPRRQIWRRIVGMAACLGLLVAVMSLMTGKFETLIDTAMKTTQEAEIAEFAYVEADPQPMTRMVRNPVRAVDRAEAPAYDLLMKGKKEETLTGQIATVSSLKLPTDANAYPAIKSSDFTPNQAIADAQPRSEKRVTSDTSSRAQTIGSLTNPSLQQAGKGEGSSAGGGGSRLREDEGWAITGQSDGSQTAYQSSLREASSQVHAGRKSDIVDNDLQENRLRAYDGARAEWDTDIDKSLERQVAEKKTKESTPSSVVPSAMAADGVFAGKYIDAISGKILDELQKSATTAAPTRSPHPELWASQEPYSTFSLRVSDNSFRMAQAAMAQNEKPAADSIRVEEFYNAFDYADPMPAAQEPVAICMEQSSHPVLPQRQLLRIALRTASAGRDASQPLHLTLLVDQSGSMARSDRHKTLMEAIKELGSLLQAQDQISLIGFSRTPRLLAEKIPGNEMPRILEQLARTPSDGGTNLEEALKLAELVASRNQNPTSINRIMLMTDGAANLGNADPQRLSTWVKELRQKKIAFDVAGVGTDGLNDPLLLEIARHGNGRYFIMSDDTQTQQSFATQLAGAFRPAAENVKVQVVFNPRRVGRYQLIGFEKDRLQQEDFRNDSVDAAEMAAAEAGQALYQLEILPDGVGEIGEVFVRFRDAASKQMMERKWTIRHDASAPTFERTSPTLQLAGLAMLTAQKLQGGEGASMVRFSEMAETCRHVQQSFPHSQRVGELIEMIQQLQD